MRVVASLAFAVLLCAALAGCTTDKDPKTDSADPTSGGSGTGSASRTASGSASGSPGSVGASGNRAPTANLTAALGNVTDANGTLAATAGLNVTFVVNGTDADGDKLTWTLSFGDNATANGTALPANATHAFAEPGLYNVSLAVSDGKLSAVANLTVNVTAGGPVLPTTVLHVDDAGGDATTPATELVWFEASIQGAGEETALVIVLQVDTLWPTTAALTPVSYSAIVNGRQFDSFARYPIDANPMTWDGGGYMAGGTSSWDTAANQVTFTFPLTLLAETYDIAYPFQLHAAANFGGLAVTETDDSCPDSGDVPF